MQKSFIACVEEAIKKTPQGLRRQYLMTLCVEGRLIDVFAVLAAYGDLGVVAGLAVADDLGVDVEAAGYVDDALCGGLVGVELHTVAHIEDGVHLFPVAVGREIGCP